MRPRKLNDKSDLVILKIIVEAAKFYKSQKSCNQFYIAKKIKDEFHFDGYSDEWEKNTILGMKYGCNPYEIHNIRTYIYSATPAAIVQMCKRLKNRYKTIPTQ